MHPGPVGKAQDRAGEEASEHFRYVVPCADHIDPEAIRRHLAQDRYFWLDLTRPSGEDLHALRELFGFHPLALEDTEHFEQRPKLDDYGDYVFLVFYGCWHEAPGRRARCTRSTSTSPAATWSQCTATSSRCWTASASSSTAGGCTPSSSCSTACWTRSPRASSPCSRRWTIRSTTWRTRSWTARCPSSWDGCSRSSASWWPCARSSPPQRDLFARSIDQIAQLPGRELDERDYFRDTLTVIATVFLPLSFITGFFGMNFAYLTGHIINASWTFWALGLGSSLVLTCVALGVFFRRKGWA